MPFSTSFRTYSEPVTFQPASLCIKGWISIVAPSRRIKSNDRSTKTPRESTSEISDRANKDLVRSLDCFQKAPSSERMPLARNGEDEAFLENEFPQSLNESAATCCMLAAFIVLIIFVSKNCSSNVLPYKPKCLIYSFIACRRCVAFARSRYTSYWIPMRILSGPLTAMLNRCSAESSVCAPRLVNKNANKEGCRPKDSG